MFDLLRRRAADAVLAVFMALAPSYAAEWRMWAVPPAYVLPVGDPMTGFDRG